MEWNLVELARTAAPRTTTSDRQRAEPGQHRRIDRLVEAELQLAGRHQTVRAVGRRRPHQARARRVEPEPVGLCESGAVHGAGPGRNLDADARGSRQATAGRHELNGLRPHPLPATLDRRAQLDRRRRLVLGRSERTQRTAEHDAYLLTDAALPRGAANTTRNGPGRGAASSPPPSASVRRGATSGGRLPWMQAANATRSSTASTRRRRRDRRNGVDRSRARSVTQRATATNVPPARRRYPGPRPGRCGCRDAAARVVDHARRRDRRDGGIRQGRDPDADAPLPAPDPPRTLRVDSSLGGAHGAVRGRPACPVEAGTARTGPEPGADPTAANPAVHGAPAASERRRTTVAFLGARQHRRADATSAGR